MPKLFTVEIQGVHGSGGGPSGRTGIYQLIAETAADALIASLRRWSASDRSNEDIRYVSLTQNMNEVIEVEGRVDLRNVEFLSDVPATSPSHTLTEEEEMLVHQVTM